MLESKVSERKLNKPEKSQTVSVPGSFVERKIPQILQHNRYDIVGIANKAIFIGFSAVAIYAFYSVLMSFML